MAFLPGGGAYFGALLNEAYAQTAKRGKARLLANYQKDKTGSSTAFLPHSGTIFFNPNGQIPINRFVSQPGYDIYQTETKS